MSTPSSPAPPEGQPGSDSGSESSPTRKRPHSEMVRGQQGAPRTTSPIQISSTRSHSSDTENGSARLISTPSRKDGKPEGGQLGTQFPVDEDAMDPEQPLEGFDWQDLEQRYHHAMKKRDEEDQKLYDEFDELIRFFRLWAGTTPHYEVDRSFFRMRTRMAHVQNSERKLEEKREHYTKVVDAFESALRLLDV